MAGKVMVGAGPCPECGTRMIPTISGIKCPRFSACGRGGLEETVDKLPKARAQYHNVSRRGSVET